MYRNLLAEMARKGYNRYDVAEAIGKSYNHVRTKLLGHTPFLYDEALAIQEKLFPEHDIKYLFEEFDVKEEA